jgi:SEC-C motif-containing protein
MNENAKLCPCQSGHPFSACCAPVLNGKMKAATAEDLLRARYSAFATGAIDFVIATHHSKTRDQVNRDEIETWSKGSKWLGLRVIEKEAGGAADDKGTIIFHAQYETDGKLQNHYERSYFEKENGEWKFLDAEGLQAGPYVRAEPKVGRNDPCHCGSGKKFKKCHGTAA